MNLQWRNLARLLSESSKDENFLGLVYKLENLISKILSLALIIVILISIIDLIIILAKDLSTEPNGF